MEELHIVTLKSLHNDNLQFVRSGDLHKKGNFSLTTYSHREAHYLVFLYCRGNVVTTRSLLTTFL